VARYGLHRLRTDRGPAVCAGSRAGLLVSSALRASFHLGTPRYLGTAAGRRTPTVAVKAGQLDTCGVYFPDRTWEAYAFEQAAAFEMSTWQGRSATYVETSCLKM
jgi:hypothetical protein